MRINGVSESSTARISVGCPKSNRRRAAPSHRYFSEHQAKVTNKIIKFSSEGIEIVKNEESVEDQEQGEAHCNV